MVETRSQSAQAARSSPKRSAPQARKEENEYDDVGDAAATDGRTGSESASAMDGRRKRGEEIANGADTADAGGVGGDDAVPVSKSALVLTAVLAAISYLTLPETLHLPPGTRPTLLHVWYYGWISALSTGLGVLPLVFAPELDTFWIGVSNAVAAGMMIAASYSLTMEGVAFDEPDDMSTIPSSLRTALGAGLGLLFIVGTKGFLERHEELHIGNLAGADFRKVLLIVFVMTLHSFSEGVGIGVSFGGENGGDLGVFISASLAVHNIPEGLAVAVVLLPRKVPKLTAALWCILTSLPQPVMAVPAFLFVHYFIPILPVGLGFAGGAMAWVAMFELLGEAIEDTKSIPLTAVISTIALLFMLGLQGAIDER